MKVFIVYCHPSNDSFTYQAKNEFIKGILDAGHKFEISDLYGMKFNSEFTEQEYFREGYYDELIPLSEDVLNEQKKIQNADAIVFVYPVFWTEAPSKLVGWFDRVWTCGFTYGAVPKIKELDKALFIAIAGKTIKTLEETGEADAMRIVMLGDRIRHRVKIKEIVFLDGTSRWNEELRNKQIGKHLKTVYELGLNF